jgi:acyl carrier protein
MGHGNDETFGDVVRLIVEVLGQEFLVDVEITGDTTFNGDLGLESIEFVVLTDKLNERYGERVDFVAFLADMDIDEIMAMSVGRLVTYIEQRIQVAGDGAA